MRTRGYPGPGPRYRVAMTRRSGTVVRTLTSVLAILLLSALVAGAQSGPRGSRAAGGGAVRDTSKLKDPSQLTETAPGVFRARFTTSIGVFVIEAHRDWAPLAADRFYNLVKNGFYDGNRFFRVLDGFMAQFGLNGDPEIQSAWRAANLLDEPVTQSNVRGYVTFTREAGANSRYTMVFINYKDNSYLDADGFAPFGQVVAGMDVLDKLYSGYGRTNVPDQRRIIREGNAYLQQEYPKLDFIRTATLERESAR
jgi:peptidyl-prolyl cis-trans isomerase A (cyclophilin A)